MPWRSSHAGTHRKTKVGQCTELCVADPEINQSRFDMMWLIIVEAVLEWIALPLLPRPCDSDPSLPHVSLSSLISLATWLSPTAISICPDCLSTFLKSIEHLDQTGLSRAYPVLCFVPEVIGGRSSRLGKSQPSPITHITAANITRVLHM